MSAWLSKTTCWNSRLGFLPDYGCGRWMPPPRRHHTSIRSNPIQAPAGREHGGERSGARARISNDPGQSAVLVHLEDIDHVGCSFGDNQKSLIRTERQRCGRGGAPAQAPRRVMNGMQMSAVDT